MAISRTHLTPPVVAEMLGCGPDTVIHFIAVGELRATNLGRSSRPRWRISRDDLQHFMDNRSNQRPTAAKPKSAKPKRVYTA